MSRASRALGLTGPMPEGFPAPTGDVDVAIDVERIMEQIRARIEDRRRRAAQRPADERRGAAAPAPPLTPSISFEFDEDSIYRSSRGAAGRVLRGVRRLLRPFVKFVFNVDPVVHALVMQARLNEQQTALDDDVARRLADRDEQDARHRAAVLDLTAEVRRLSAEMQDHRRIVESVAARMDAPAPARSGEQVTETRSGRQADEEADGDAFAGPVVDDASAKAAVNGASAAPAADGTLPPGGGAADAPAGDAAPAPAPPAER